MEGTAAAQRGVGLFFFGFPKNVLHLTLTRGRMYVAGCLLRCCGWLGLGLVRSRVSYYAT